MATNTEPKIERGTPEQQKLAERARALVNLVNAVRRAIRIDGKPVSAGVQLVTSEVGQIAPLEEIRARISELEALAESYKPQLLAACCHRCDGINRCAEPLGLEPIRSGVYPGMPVSAIQARYGWLCKRWNEVERERGEREHDVQTACALSAWINQTRLDLGEAAGYAKVEAGIDIKSPSETRKARLQELYGIQSDLRAKLDARQQQRGGRRAAR